MKLGLKIYGMTIGMISVFAIIICILLMGSIEESIICESQSSFVNNADGARDALSMVAPSLSPMILDIHMHSNELGDSILYYYMTDANNKIIYSSLNDIYPEIMYTDPLPEASDEYSFSTRYDNERTYVVCLLLEDGNYLYIGYDMGATYSRLSSLRCEIMAILVVVGSVFILLSYVLDRSILSSINTLSYGTKKIARGDFEHRLPEGGDDELGELMKSFNEMADARSRTERDLLSLYEHLKMQNDELEEFTNKFYHETQTPLSTIGGYASLLEDSLEQGDVGAARESSVVIIKAARNLSKSMKVLGDNLRKRRS